MRTLTALQESAVQNLRISLASHSRSMLQAPTGFGKSVLISAVSTLAVSRNKRVNICVPSISLIDQLVDSLKVDGLKHVGVIQSNHELTDPSAPVQVCSTQSLMRRRIPDADLVIIDEAHRWFDFYGQWMSDWNRVPFIGMSATPWTKGLGNWYQDLVIAATTGDLIGSGHLSPFRVFAPTTPDLSRCRTVADDYHRGDLSKAMRPIVGDVVRYWLEHGENRPTLCFAVDRAHARDLLTKFREAMIPADYVDAFTPREVRAQIGARLNSGELSVVVNVGCLTTGVDWDVRCIILARPTKSEILLVQIIGRGLRTAKGKDDCLVFDHTGTHEALGTVLDIHHTRLSTAKHPLTKSVKPEAKPTVCPECKALKEARARLCPVCGFVPARVSNVVEIEGQLDEITPKKLNRKTPAIDKRQFYAELLGYAKRRQFRPGWADNKYREKFGVWPNAFKDTEPETPTPVTLNWIRSRNIAWAKRRTA